MEKGRRGGERGGERKNAILVCRHDANAKKFPAARLDLLLVPVLSWLLLLRAELRENTLLDGLLNRLDVLLQLLAALDILLILAKGVKVTVVPGLLHGASEAEDVLSSANLCSRTRG